MLTIEQWIALSSALLNLVLSGLALAFWLGGQKKLAASTDEKIGEFVEHHDRDETSYRAQREREFLEYKERCLQEKLAERDSEVKLRHEAANNVHAQLLRLESASTLCTDRQMKVLERIARLEERSQVSKE